MAALAPATLFGFWLYGWPAINLWAVSLIAAIVGEAFVVYWQGRAVRPVLMDGSDLDNKYQENAERILLQSVAASTMSAHLAAAALGYSVWWVTAIGQEGAQAALKPLLGVPDELAIIDIFCFGPAAKPPYKRWKKDLGQIVSWDRFDMANYMTVEQIEGWIKTKRSQVMYRDESKVD